MPSNLDVQDFASIVHVTTGENCCSVGSRIPAVWYHPRGDLHITTGSDGNGNYIQNFDLNKGNGDRYAPNMEVSVIGRYLSLGPCLY